VYTFVIIRNLILIFCNLCSLVAYMRYSSIVLLGFAAAKVVVGIRTLTGECRPGPPELVGKETANRIVMGIVDRRADTISREFVYASLKNKAKKSIEKARHYMQEVPDTRMRMSLQLYNFLVEFSRDEGERPTDAQSVWDEYISAHPDDATGDCNKMQVWYTTVFGLGTPRMLALSGNSIDIRREFEGLFAYVDITRIAHQRTPQSHWALIDQYMRSYERYVIAQWSIADMQELEAALGRPARFVSAEELPNIVQDRDTVLSDTQDSQYYSTMRFRAPQTISLAQEWDGDLVRPGIYIPNSSANAQFIQKLIHEILSLKFRCIAPSWDEVRRVLQNDFPQLGRDSAPHRYAKLKEMADLVVKTISMPTFVFEGVVKGVASPANVDPARILWVKMVLTPNNGRTVGAANLVFGPTHESAGYIPRSMDIVRELLEARFGQIQIPPRIVTHDDPTTPLLHLIPDRERISHAMNNLIEDAPRVPQAVVDLVLGMKRTRNQETSKGIDLLLEAANKMNANRSV
jgi:hypothetical protein